MPIEEKHNKPKDKKSNQGNDESETSNSEFEMEEERKAPEMEAMNRKFELEDHIDCLDTVNHWLNAVVTSVRDNMIRVHYNGWHAKYDEWIDMNSHRVQKQWIKGKEFSLNNRLDILDERDTWLEARVIDMTSDKIRIHYYGYSSKFDEWILKNSDRIAEVGSHSKAYGGAKYRQENSNNEHRQKLLEAMRNEANFKDKLRQKRLAIKEIGGDGNCLFRAFADQLYADQDQHPFIRQVCMDYIETERDFYKNFVVGGNSRFNEYMARKRTEGVWGDDLEIQALSEIYDRPIEIYAYSAEPMRTFHEVNQNNRTPIRLSYHGASHYNSVKKITQENEPLLDTEIGDIESTALKNATERAEQRKENRPIESNNVVRGSEATLIKDIINLSRKEFENAGRRDMEIALEESLASFNQQEAGKLTEQELEETIKKSMDVYEEQKNEEELIKMIINETKNEQQNVMEEELKRAIEESKKNAGLGMEEENLYPAGVRQALEAGFPEEYVLSAYSIVGDNADMIISFIYENYMS